jgi:hypothetical protein
MVGSGDLKSQCLLRFALGVANEQDARLAIDDSQLARGVAGLRQKGAMYVQDDVARPVPTKTYRVEFEQISSLARARSWLRPGLEPELEAALGEAYAGRWSKQRAGHLVSGTMPVAHEPPAVSAPGSAARSAPPAQYGLPTIPLPPANAEPAWRTARGEAIPRAFDRSEFDAAFAELTDRLGDLDTPSGAPHQGRLRLVGLLAEAGRGGLGPADLVARLNAEGIKCVRQTVQEWLADAVRDGTVVKRDKGLYVHPDHA